MGTSKIAGMGRGVGDVQRKEMIGEHLVHGAQQANTHAMGTLSRQRAVV